MHGGAQSRAEVGRARSDVAEMVVLRELGHLLDLSGRVRQPLEDRLDVRTLLHGDDAQLVLFVDPHKERLLIVVVDAATIGPITVEAGGLKETVAFLEQEVVLDKLRLNCLVHTLERVVLAGKLAGQLREDSRDHLLTLVSLRLGDARAEWEVCEIAADADARRENECVLLRIELRASELFPVHVALMLVVSLMAMVVLDDVIEQLVEGVVTVVAARVDADSRVEVLSSRENHLLEGHNSLVFLAAVLFVDGERHVFAQERLNMRREVDKAGDVLRLLQVRASVNSGTTIVKNLLHLDHGFEAVVHILHEVALGAAEASLVGNIEDSIVSFSVLTMDASDLDVVPIRNIVEQFHVFCQIWQRNVDRGPQGRAKVGWT